MPKEVPLILFEHINIGAEFSRQYPEMEITSRHPDLTTAEFEAVPAKRSIHQETITGRAYFSEREIDYLRLALESLAGRIANATENDEWDYGLTLGNASIIILNKNYYLREIVRSGVSSDDPDTA